MNKQLVILGGSALLSLCVLGAEPTQRTLVSSAVADRPASSESQIETTFDRNKGAIYALYARALRDNPKLKGRFSFRLSIAESGRVTNCTVLSSELKDPALEARICARLSLVQFGTLPGPMSYEKFFDFFPA